MKKITTIFLLTGMYFSPQVQGQTTYNDVAPIFYKHCTSCHHTGGGAPFPLMNYSDASPWSTNISNAVQNKYGILMPPWHADTAYTASGHLGARFLHENTITEVEKNKIIQWVTDGASEGPALTITAPAYGHMPYQLNGTADLTLKITPFHSNSTTANSNPYNCFVVPTNLTQGRWLRAFEIVPGEFVNGSAGNVVHHVVVSVDTAATKAVSDTSGNCGAQPGQFGIGGWSAGAPPTVYPNDPSFKTGVWIPAGSNIVMQIHYAPGSGGKVDTTGIRLFFYPIGTTAGIRPMHSVVMLQNWDFANTILGNPSIAIGATKTFIGTSTSPGPGASHAQPAGSMSVFAINPHSHNVCTKIKIYAFSGTDTIPVIRINEWNYNWQGNYYFPKLFKIPAGHTLQSEHFYDNRVTNPHLSVAPINVSFGQATANEMLFDGVVWVDYQTGDENIDVKALLANDALLQVGINEVAASSGIQSFIYPNPASDNVNIYVSGKSVYKGRIFNITGQTILNTETFNNKITVDVKNIPAGLYVVEIVDIKTNDRITKKIIISNQ